MSRLWQSGFELNSIVSDVEWSVSNGSPIISTSTVRSGTYSLQISSLSSGADKRVRRQFASAAANGPYFIRVYLNIATLPSAENRIVALTGSNTANTNVRQYITLDSGGLLRLYDEDGQVGSASSALSTGVWYRIELKFDISPAAGSHVIEAKIDGTTFATASNRNISAGVFNLFIGGNLALEAQTTGNWFFDDVAINDSTGSFQTGYAGPGKIIHLKPNAAGDINGFLVAVGGSAGAANNFGRVNEVTPDDATSYNASAVLNAEDLFNCDDSGIGTGDSVSVVAVGVRMADLVGADATAAFKLEIEKTSGGTKTQSGTIIPNSTTFLTNAAAVPRNYPLVTYQDPDGAAWTKTTLDSLQVGYILSAVNVQSIAISTIWVSVDYLPAGISPSASRSPSASNSPSVSPSSSNSPSISPSASISPSSSNSPSISPSSSRSPSSSSSASISPSSSISASISPSASISASISPSASSSASRSPSASISASISPSASFSPSQPPFGAILKRWTGTAWVKAKLKVFRTSEIIDQASKFGNIGIGFGDTGNGRDYMVQGFIPTLNNITAIAFQLLSKSGNTDIGYKVWIDTCDANSNPLHGIGGIGGSSEITNAQLVVGALTKYILTSSVTLIPGNRYVLCFAPWNTTTHAFAASLNDFKSSVSNPYANGRRVHLDGSFANPTAPDSGNADINFETYGNTPWPIAFLKYWNGISWIDIDTEG